MFFFKEFSESITRFDKGLAPRTAFQKIHFASLSWEAPVIAAILYAVIVTVWGRYNRAKAAKAAEPRVKAKNKGDEESVNRFSPFNCFVIAHNVLLTLFSAYCFVCIVQILIDSYMTDNFADAYCDRNLKQYYSGVNYLVWLFYMSKYYELLDTFILLMKGKSSSFLQTYHHSGSILSLWTMVVTRIPGIWIFTFLNSFIHTLMYYYYTLTCLGYRPKWKRHLTTMQITQFLIGNVLGIAYLIIPNCYNWSSNFRENLLQHKIFGSYFGSIVFTFLFNFFFVGGLILLFNDFARRTYGSKKAVEGDSSSKTSKSAGKAVKAAPSKAPKAAKTTKKAKTSPVQVATSVVIENEAPAKASASKSKYSKAKSSKSSKSAKPSASRSQSRARSTVRSKSKARAASPAKAVAARRSRRT